MQELSKQFVLSNGKVIPFVEAHIPISNRSFQFGEGVFTTFRVQDGKALNMERHYQRLQDHCRFLDVKNALPDPDAIQKLIQLNQAVKGIWKGKVIVSKNEDETVSTILFLEPYKDISKPWTLATIDLPRHPVLSKYKTTSYLERAWLSKIAIQNNVDGMLICDEKKTVLETSIAAFIWIYQDKLYFPTLDLPLLKSTALAQIVDSNMFESISVKSELSEIPSEANLFAINALRGPIPVRSVNSKSFPLNQKVEHKLLSCLGICRNTNFECVSV